MGRAIACLTVLAAMAACGEEDPPTPIAGMSGGVAGMTAPTAPMAGTSGGAAGTVAGTMAGMNGAPTGPCDQDSGLTGAALHAAVQMWLGPQPGTCNASPCHDTMGPPRGALLLGDITDMRTALVDVASCQAPNLPLIAPGNPEGSYLWIKLTGAIDPVGELIGDSAWGTPGNCFQDVGTYGVRMPFGIGTGMASNERLVELCDWIQAGAPGPNG